MSDDFDDPGAGQPTALPGGFRAAVTHALAGFGYRVVGWEADGVNVAAPAKEGQQYIGLSNLYRRAKGAERVEWTNMIREFLDHVTGALAGPTIPGDLAAVVSQLRPRLGKPFDRRGKAHPWGITLPGTGLEINLVIDYPNTMAYVTAEMLEKTDRTAEDLLDIALANLHAETPADFLERVSEELDIYVGHTGDGYDAARALLLDDLLPELETSAGFWVAIPSREELAVWPVSFDALGKIHVLKMFATDNFRDHAYPVTDDVFWVCNGTWYPFGITIDDENITVSPPEEFLKALQAMGDGCRPCEGEPEE